jgi:hypothetical protein
MERPEVAAFEAAAPLVECALNTDVSTPADPMKHLIQRLIVLAETSRNGETNAINMWGELETARLFTVRSTYDSRAHTGQHKTS